MSDLVYYTQTIPAKVETQNYDARVGDIVTTKFGMAMLGYYDADALPIHDQAYFLAQLLGSIKDLDPNIKRHFVATKGESWHTEARDTFHPVDGIIDGVDIVVLEQGSGMGSWYALTDVKKFGWVSFQMDFNWYSPIQFFNFTASRIYAPLGKITGVRTLMFDDCLAVMSLVRPGFGSETVIGPTVEAAATNSLYSAVPPPVPRGF